MKKIVYIDVGTHFANEFQSFFGSQIFFYRKIFRRLIGFYIFRRGEMAPFRTLVGWIGQRNNLRKYKDHFMSVLVEANAKVIKECDVYRKADGVFNCALTGEKSVSLKNLYLANRDILGQGSSIFSTKSNVNVEDIVLTLAIPSAIFFDSLKNLIDSRFSEYSIILRLNCEGVEDDVIYSAHQVFSGKLKLVMGSLKDVRFCKGEEAYDDLKKYLYSSSVPFVFFSNDLNSWCEAHKSINSIVRTHLL
jgi:hypothetical protein